MVIHIKNKLSFILRFLVSFCLLLVLCWIIRKDAKNILYIIKNTNKLYLALALMINVPIAVALSYRLKLLMCGQHIKLSNKDAIYLTFIGYFFNNFLPTAIGGDIAKAYYASKKTNNKPASYAAVIVDRLFGFLATISIAMIGLIFMGKDMENKALLFIIPAMFIILAGLILIVLKKKILINTHSAPVLNKLKEKLLKLYTAIKIYNKCHVLLVKTFVVSVILQGLSILSTYFFILSTGGSINLLKLFLILPLVWAVSMLPSLNGLGVREGAFVYFLKNYIGKEKAFTVSILWLGVILLYSIVGGIFHLLYPMREVEKTHTPKDLKT